MSNSKSEWPRQLSARDVLFICRVSNLPTVWMNALAAVLLAGEAAPGTITLLWVSFSALYCGGMCLNDLFDREVDAREQPFRPIPAGRVSVQQATALAVSLLGSGLALLLLVPHPRAIGLGGVLLALIILYDRLHKRHPATVLLMAGCRGMIYPTSAFAVAGSVAPQVALAGLLQAAYTVLVTAVARHENRRGRRFGYPWIPVLIAGMALLDGLVLAVLVAPGWLAAGATGFALTRWAQRHVRGD